MAKRTKDLQNASELRPDPFRFERASRPSTGAVSRHPVKLRIPVMHQSYKNTTTTVCNERGARIARRFV